jgi:hypothetical protein
MLQIYPPPIPFWSSKWPFPAQILYAFLVSLIVAVGCSLFSLGSLEAYLLFLPDNYSGISIFHLTNFLNEKCKFNITLAIISLERKFVFKTDIKLSMRVQ